MSMPQWKRHAANCPVKLSKFRHVGATALGGNDSYLSLVEHYLGHSPNTITEKHYKQPSQELFDRATEWLRTTLGL